MFSAASAPPKLFTLVLLSGLSVVSLNIALDAPRQIFVRGRGLHAKADELAIAFATFEARHYAGVTPVDKDPEAYVEANGLKPDTSNAPGGLCRIIEGHLGSGVGEHVLVAGKHVAIDGLPDQKPGTMDPTHLAGNHVMLDLGQPLRPAGEGAAQRAAALDGHRDDDQGHAGRRWLHRDDGADEDQTEDRGDVACLHFFNIFTAVSKQPDDTSDTFLVAFGAVQQAGGEDRRRPRRVAAEARRAVGAPLRRHEPDAARADRIAAPARTAR